MNEIETIQKCLETGVLLSAKTFEHLSFDALLSKRDSQAFEEKWLALFNLTEQLSFGEQQTFTINRIRELAFKAVFSATANSDLAGYVSDDFEIISKGIAGKLRDGFLFSLVMAYSEGRIPAEPNLNSQKDVSNIIRALRGKLPE